MLNPTTKPPRIQHKPTQTQHKTLSPGRFGLSLGWVGLGWVLVEFWLGFGWVLVGFWLGWGQFGLSLDSMGSLGILGKPKIKCVLIPGVLGGLG